MHAFFNAGSQRVFGVQGRQREWIHHIHHEQLFNFVLWLAYIARFIGAVFTCGFAITFAVGLVLSFQLVWLCGLFGWAGSWNRRAL